MASDLETVFTTQSPLGPIAIDDQTEPAVLRALYDTRVRLHMQSQYNPPTFIVGRRGSGKTSLLLSTQLDPRNLTVLLSTDGAFSRVQAALDMLQQRLVLTEEGAADVWWLLLWGPIATRLGQDHRRGDPEREYQLLWEETAPLRALAEAASPDEISQDDIVIDHVAHCLLRHIETADRMFGTDTLARSLVMRSRPWSECIGAAQTLIHERRARVYVLVDSLENVGQHLHRLDMAMKGLLHLVGRIGMKSGRRPFQLQCCFPAELWSLVDTISANPTKDFANRMVLQWHGDDLVRAAALRLKSFLEHQFPRFRHPAVGGAELLAELLPAQVHNRQGIPEPTIAYMLRHTQLLPRQFFYILNEAMHRAVVATDAPYVREEDIVDAVSEVETTLCPEIFAAHRFKHPQAHDLARDLIPFLPFRFNDGLFHKMYNQAGIREKYGLDYREVREMFARVGILGRFVKDEDFYVNAEFEYTLGGSLNLNPHEDYCLHPLFVRLYSSRDVVQPTSSTRPVYPAGTPVGI